jgi:PAS domain S-box-containing protein
MTTARKIISIAWRYILPLVVFGLILLISTLAKQYLSFSLDLTSLVIVLMIATAWYLGRGPGLLIAVAFEAMILYYGVSPKSAFITLNRMVLFVSVVLFASSRRNAENRLRRQSELLQVTLSSIGDAVIATDTDGKINFINPTAEALTGWTATEAAGKPLDEVFCIVGEETNETVENPFSSIKRDGLAVGLANHTALVARDGAKIPIENSGSPIKDTNGEIVGVVIVFHDVSRRRQAEREREQLLKSEQAARAEAETASRLKDDFLATVSHELRSPLSAILGWSAMLNKGKLEEATVRNALGIIERNARAQAAIINDILDVSRIITGKLHINSHAVEIDSLIGEAVETLRPAAIAKSITLSVALGEIKGSIVGDTNRLRQVVWNLISNAIKFTPENGRVEISLEQVDSHAEIKVSDNGAGIDEHFLPFAFERFRQSDSSTTRAQGGLGLGLSIVRHLVELHGGTVTAESAGAGHGATFIVRLPLSEKGEDLIIPTSSLSAVENAISKEILIDAPDIRGLRVLIVDDDTDTLEVLRVVLKQYGAQVRIAVSTADALEVFHEWKPDVLISDLGMPAEDGYALIGKIRALPPEQGGSIPAAALTAYVSEKDRLKSLSSGYQIHIAKPVDPTTIAAAVAEIKSKV